MQSKSRTPPVIRDHETLRIIGRGAFGEVWLARSVTGVLRAVKVVWREDYDKPDSFEREFEAIKRFEPISRRHEALVPILQVGRSDQEGVARTYAIDKADRPLLRELHLITMKPLMYVANVAEGGFTGNPYLDAVSKRAAEEGADVVPVCAAIEAEIAQLDADDRIAFLEELGLHEPGLDRVIRAAYHLLGLLTFFTVGPKEARAWTAHLGALAPQAAGEIHTDFEKGFIRAEVISYDDYVACKGEQGAKEAGRMRLEGKEYVVREGDVMHFRFNV